MEEDPEKIKKLEEQLDKLSSQLNAFRKELYEVKSGNQRFTGKSKPETTEEFISPKKAKWEFPSAHREDQAGLENFIGLRLLHIVGIVVLVIGISIGVKYAIDKELISPAARVGLAYAAGLSLFFISVRLKSKFHLFSAILFSGAMASLYFTTYAAFVYYGLFHSGLAFALMVLITFLTSVMAIRYDRQEIAILGMIGAYGIPFLISSNSDRSDLFFTYITLINAGVVFLSMKKTWKGMVRLAMLGSWFLFIAWALSRYEPQMQTIAATVMVVFYLMFAFASLAFAIRNKEPLGIVDIQLFLLNSILAYAGAVIVFTDSTLDNRAVMVTGLAALVFGVQAIAAKTFLPKEKLIYNYLLAFSIASLVFYVGMKWDGIIVTVLWLLIAVALFVAGVFTKEGWLRLLSLILTGVTLGKLILVDRHVFNTGQKIIAYISIGVILLLLSFFYQKSRKPAADG
jgi:uncharacterized membrane protein